MAPRHDLLSKTILLEIPPDILRSGARPGSEQATSDTKSSSRSKASSVIEDAALKVLFENVYDAALITDLAGDILTANPRASHAFTYIRPEFCDRNISDIVLGFDDEVMKMVCDNLTNDQFTLIQASCLRKDRSEFPAEISTSRIHLSGRDYLCFFIRDVTARREAEEQLQEAHDKLEAEVKERTKLNEELNVEIAVRTGVEGKLREAISKLQEHDLAKSEFVSNVSHELKTPLSSINHASGNLLKGIAGPLSDQAKTYLGMIRADCRRLARTVEDILDMSRIEARTLKLRCVKIQFPRFVRQTVESMRIQMDAAGLVLSVVIDASTPFVNGDPQKLERVIFNVIWNAIKFNIPHGAVEVRLQGDPGRPGFLLLEVIDTGVGIEAKHLKRVTERFFRVGEHVSGAGLGLAISKELIEHHGGTIELQSPPPGRMQGTWVGLRFPVTPPPVVLVVGDDPDVNREVAGQISTAGYDVVNAGIGLAFDELLVSRKPDLVVLGWLTPGLEAAVVISVMRSTETSRAIPMMIISSSAESPVKQEILRGAGVPILTAPWQEEDLFRRMEQVVVGKRPMTI